ncbi:4-oxalomesaconate tautomerase [Gordonia bronchialis]|uniref:4-oxalomesaconate tautomerase n=1 Tax=Gordonia bronchialis TaxID=2054 RepID=UPI002271471B|nr:4-oxalomesaconate tautomerase [Gordonia bronchialis]
MSGTRCMLMRGGTSKGAYFLATDLPADRAERDSMLLRAMGSPDPRQIDGIGGGHPLTSKVAVISPSARPDADVDYLFLQVAVDAAGVTDAQNCGNILAGVGPFAVERGLVPARAAETSVRIYQVNSRSIATATFPTAQDGTVDYNGDAEIAGVPGAAAPIRLTFADTAGSTCGSLFPSGNLSDDVDGVQVTCIDNGMPVVLIRAAGVGITGTESPPDLEANTALADRLAVIRDQAGKLMGFDDLTGLSIPKITLVAPPADGGTLSTRTFIPVRAHTSIGVLGALTVAAAAHIPGTVAHQVAASTTQTVRIEHPTGFLDCCIDVTSSTGGHPTVEGAAVLRTARKLFDGEVFPAPPH